MSVCRWRGGERRKGASCVVLWLWPVTTGRAFCLIAAALVILTAGAPAARAEDAVSAANRQFIQAMKLIERADSTYDSAEESSLLKEADRILNEIVQHDPESPLAVQLATNQFIGDFDVVEFHNRVHALVCNDPISDACFLYRVEQILPPIEYPIAQARWDWLGLAVAYYNLGDQPRARTLIAPFVSALRRKMTESADEDFYVPRALALTGQSDLALQFARKFDDCSIRSYDLTDIAKAALWRNERDLAASVTSEAASYATKHDCKWELGLVAQAEYRIGHEAEARTLFLNTVQQQYSRFHDSPEKSDCCPAELAVAAGDLADPDLALNLMRTVQQENPWTVPAVLGRLCARGETAQTLAFAETIKDSDLQAEVFARMIGGLIKRGPSTAALVADLTDRLNKLADDNAGKKPKILIQRAKVERLTFSDQRWRQTFTDALAAAEKSSAYTKRDIGVPLLSGLVEIETGFPMLE
ncbi:MAG: hypothetical protein P4M00_10135 [Azospirillaceae bacterium]|nr:hypothetical protein [Azospirillaceae bacterium]